MSLLYATNLLFRSYTKCFFRVGRAMGTIFSLCCNFVANKKVIDTKGVMGVSYLPKEEEECYGVGLGLVLLVDVLLIDTVDDNAYCLVDGMED